jgi:hypothetical protein
MLSAQGIRPAIGSGEDGSMKDSQPGNSLIFGTATARAAFVVSAESKLSKRDLLMSKSESMPATPKSRSASVWILAIHLTVVVPILAASAVGQDFTLQMDPFPYPTAIAPGGASDAPVMVIPVNGFSGTVLLTCQVTTQETGVTPPMCAVSPSSLMPPEGATVTATSTGLTTPGVYAFTVTGTISGTTTSVVSNPQNLTVLAVTPQFTINVTSAVAPSSVHAGSGGTGTISVNPLSGYSIPKGGVTLSCSSITPLVTAPPVCSFDPNPILPGQVSSTLTINTTGPTTLIALVQFGSGYALWLSLPMLALAGMASVSGKRSRRACGLFTCLAVGGLCLLAPACGSTSTVAPTPSNLITPNNAYTFTLSGVDANGVASSNTGTNSSAPTVTLTVD